MSPSPVVAAEDSPAVAERPVPLWRNLQFQTLWVGQAASSLGAGVANVAYPLAILALTGSPGQAGLFAAVQTAGLAAGACRRANSPTGAIAARSWCSPSRPARWSPPLWRLVSSWAGCRCRS